MLSNMKEMVFASMFSTGKASVHLLNLSTYLIRYLKYLNSRSDPAMSRETPTHQPCKAVSWLQLLKICMHVIQEIVRGLEVCLGVYN